jgi:phage baseplate assembly protein W
MANENSPFIGIGWSWPPAFTAGGEKLEMTTGFEDIENSLQILLSTALQERVMQPAYGCNLDGMLFETVNEHFKTYLAHLVKTSITYYEARIKADNIEVKTDEENEGRVLIVVDYTIRSTNTKYNFVFPFYINF